MAYLNALVGRECGGLLEVRWRHEDGMRRRVFRDGDELPAAVRAILELGARNYGRSGLNVQRSDEAPRTLRDAEVPEALTAPPHRGRTPRSTATR
jgi:hypothetical protein